MADGDNKPEENEAVDRERRETLKSAALLPYVIPAITSIAVSATSAHAQQPSDVASNSGPPPPDPTNEEDPTNA